MHAKVSVIIPCYCCSETIERAVDSVANQTQLPKQLILVDDGSADEGETLHMLNHLKEKYCDYFQIDIIALQKNKGVSVARNTAWNIATQTYVAFLDSDDAWHPEKLKIQYPYMVKNPDIVLSGHEHRQLEKTMAIPDWFIEPTSGKAITRNKMLMSNPFITPSVMLKRDIPFRFSESKRYMEDHLLWSQIHCSGLLVSKIHMDLAAIYKFAYGAGGLSGQYKEMRSEEIANYKTLYDEGKINLIEKKVLLLYSFAKYCRRLAVVYMRSLKSTPC